MIVVLVAYRRLDPVIRLYGRDPRFPARANFGIGPLAVVFEDPGKADDPGSESDIYKGDEGAEEEGPVRVGRVDERCYRSLEGRCQAGV